MRRQMAGSRWTLETISNINTMGTTSRGGSSNDRPVTHSMDAPKPL